MSSFLELEGWALCAGWQRLGGCGPWGNCPIKKITSQPSPAVLTKLEHGHRRNPVTCGNCSSTRTRTLKNKTITTHPHGADHPRRGSPGWPATLAGADWHGRSAARTRGTCVLGLPGACPVWEGANCRHSSVASLPPCRPTLPFQCSRRRNQATATQGIAPRDSYPLLEQGNGSLAVSLSVVPVLRV